MIIKLKSLLLEKFEVPDNIHKPVENLVLSVMGTYYGSLLRMKIESYYYSIKQLKKEESNLYSNFTKCLNYFNNTDDEKINYEFPALNAFSTDIFIDDTVPKVKIFKIKSGNNYEYKIADDSYLLTTYDYIKGHNGLIKFFNDQIVNIRKMVEEESKRRMKIIIDDKITYQQYITPLLKIVKPKIRSVKTIDDTSTSYTIALVPSESHQMLVPITIKISSENLDYAGLYYGGSDGLLIVVPEESSEDIGKERIKENIDAVKNTIFHEVQHFWQDYKKHGIQTGLPKRKASNSIDYITNYKGKLPHPMLDIEFKTNLSTWADEIEKILHKFPKRKHKDLFRYLTSWGTDQQKELETDPETEHIRSLDKGNVFDQMSVLKNKAPDKWKQMVKELYKEVFI